MVIVAHSAYRSVQLRSGRRQLALGFFGSDHGHEVAYAVGRHGNERMIQDLLDQLVGAALSVALSQNPPQTNELFMQAYGIGAQAGVLLPYSRLQESEADQLGMIFMAMAGYDPRDALNFWRRMAKQSRVFASGISEQPPRARNQDRADQGLSPGDHGILSKIAKKLS